MAAVRARTRAALPVGATLSGGLDSSSVVGAARDLVSDRSGPLHTFSLVFPSFSGARGHYFLARGVERVAATNPDEFEEIEVVSVPVEDLRRDLAAAAPRYVTDANSALALHRALARLDGHG